MPVNANKIERWKEDIRQSVDFYNEWFLEFAPRTFRSERAKAVQQVEHALEKTANFNDITPTVLLENPRVLQMLRMGTAPPIARDRLIGLAGVSKSMVERMEDENKLPMQMRRDRLIEQLEKVGSIIERLADADIFTWLGTGTQPSQEEIHRAATVVADRLTGAMTNPILRNAQERRQLEAISGWLTARGYQPIPPGQGIKFDTMQPGTFAFRLIVPVERTNSSTKTRIPIDTIIKPIDAAVEDFPLLIEAKSAGDYTNVNKRQKEEAQKFNQLRKTYGEDVRFVLLLCGYFNAGYLGYEAAEGIDWVWEHRLDDLAEFGL